jgi:hypothetical protein
MLKDQFDLELNREKEALLQESASPSKPINKKSYLTTLAFVSSLLLISAAILYGSKNITYAAIKSNLYGGSGGQSHQRLCPKGTYVTTIYGKAGSLLSGVGIKCGNNNDQGMLGGNGGDGFSKTCPNGFSTINYGFGTIIGSLSIQCAYSSNTESLIGGNPQQVDNAGKGQFATTSCPTGQVVTGMNVRSGALVDNLEFFCGGII